MIDILISKYKSITKKITNDETDKVIQNVKLYDKTLNRMDKCRTLRNSIIFEYESFSPDAKKAFESDIDYINTSFSSIKSLKKKLKSEFSKKSNSADSKENSRLGYGTTTKKEIQDAENTRKLMSSNNELLNIEQLGNDTMVELTNQTKIYNRIGNNVNFQIFNFLILNDFKCIPKA